VDCSRVAKLHTESRASPARPTAHVCAGRLGGTTLASADSKVRLSFRQALGLWMLEEERVLL